MQSLAVGCQVLVRSRFEYRVERTDVLWNIEAGTRLLLLSRKENVWRVRAGELVMVLTTGEIEKATA